MVQEYLVKVESWVIVRAASGPRAKANAETELRFVLDAYCSTEDPAGTCLRHPEDFRFQAVGTPKLYEPGGSDGAELRRRQKEKDAALRKAEAGMKNDARDECRQGWMQRRPYR